MRSKVSPFTWLGLFISLFGFIARRPAFQNTASPLDPELDCSSAAIKLATASLV
jgi:hypothetical protein